MSGFLLLCAVVILCCVILNKISGKMGLPMLLFFIALGLFFGSDGVVKIPFENYAFAEQICSIALIFIMFYGGFGTNWEEAKPIAGKAVLLSTAGVILTCGFTGLFCRWVLGMAWLESLLIGAVISSTDAASVFSILRSKQLNLKDHTASLLEIESGSNDPCSYMLTVIILSLMQGNLTAGGMILLVAKQIVFGGLFGVGIAYLSLFVLKRFSFETNGFDAIFVVAVAVFSYALPDVLGGNGYLSAYVAGIILGNARIPNKKALVHFFDGLTGMMQMLIFFLLGLLAFPSQMPTVFASSFLIAVGLTFLIRPLVIFGLLKPFGCSSAQCGLVSWTGLRGAASIVFAIMATIHPAYTRYDLFHIVFCVVLLSISFQGTLLPWMAKKLHMVDGEANVLKTFTDYAEEEQVQFMQLALENGHPWQGKKIAQINLPPQMLLVMVIRGKQTIVPNGQTMLHEGDIAVLAAPKFEGAGEKYLVLQEQTLGKKDERIGKRIQDLPRTRQLIVLIKREGSCLLPNGRTKLNNGDVLVIYEQNETGSV